MDADERRRKAREQQVRIADTLIGAAGDPPLRAELLANPSSVFRSPDQTNTQEAPAHVEDLRRQIMTGVMDRVNADQEFAALLRQDLFQAVRAAGLSPQVEQLRAELPVNAEVSAFSWGGWGGWLFWGVWG
jgi:hypothetical protein